MNARLAAPGVAALITAAVVLAPAPAHADMTGCVTRAEYNAVSPNMTMTQVHKAFGTAGKLAARTTHQGSMNEIRVYAVCGSKASSIVIGYNQPTGRLARLLAKSAAFVAS